MLQNAVRPSEVVVNLRDICRQSATVRTAAAYDLTSGRCNVLRGLTATQAAFLTKTTEAYLSAFVHATPAQKHQMRSGILSISTLHNNRTPKPLTDRELNRLVEQVGVSRIRGAIDRMTAPHQLAAE